MSPLAGCILTGKMVTEDALDADDPMQSPGQPEHDDVRSALKAPGPGDPLGDLDEADLENPATPTLPTFEVDVKLGSTRGSSLKSWGAIRHCHGKSFSGQIFAVRRMQVMLKLVQTCATGSLILFFLFAMRLTWSKSGSPPMLLYELMHSHGVA